MLLPNDQRDLKKKYKRLGIFLLLIFIFDVFICFLLMKYTQLESVVCGVIIIAITSVLYLLFSFICVKIDKRKKQKLAESGKKDPFSQK